MKLKNCETGMRVRYNGSMETRDVKRGMVGVVTDTSSGWVKVRFPTKEAWYAAGQLCRVHSGTEVDYDR